MNEMVDTDLQESEDFERGVEANYNFIRGELLKLNTDEEILVFVKRLFKLEKENNVAE